jgi:tRNA(Glu) U13 pseudouridine synthase TruD
LRIEEQVFKSHGLTPGHFKQEGRDQAKGARRPLRVRPEEITLEGGVDNHGGYITVAFNLPSGAFATVLMRELMKNDVDEATDSPEAPPEQPDDSDAPE